jgi:hypothetical protein
MRHSSKGENFFGLLINLFWLGMLTFVLGILTGAFWLWWVTGAVAVLFTLVLFIAMFSLLL